MKNRLEIYSLHKSISLYINRLSRKFTLENSEIIHNFI